MYMMPNMYCPIYPCEARELEKHHVFLPSSAKSSPTGPHSSIPNFKGAKSFLQHHGFRTSDMCSVKDGPQQSSPAYANAGDRYQAVGHGEEGSGIEVLLVSLR